MKIRNAHEVLKKAATSFKSKTGALRTKLIILASLRRRMALASAVSRRIHALVSSDGRAKMASSRVDYYDQALVLRKAMAAVSEEKETTVRCSAQGGMVLDLFSEIDMFDEDGHAFHDWAQSLFDDDKCYVADEDVEDDDDDDLALDALDEPSVIEVIRSSREVQRLEFNMDDDIDEACDMFIRRFRSRMNLSF